MKITRLTVENVKRLVAAHVEPGEEPLVIVRGNNGAGKSSLIDAIKYALAGKSSHPPKVVRDGERHACVEVETEELLVTRRWTAGAEATTTEVEVRAKDGTKMPSPQKVLDRLYDELAFEALEFVGMKPKDQLELLKKLVPGADTALLDTRRKQIFDARTLVHRDLDSAAARLKALPSEKPPAPVDTAALLKERGELTNAQQWERQTKAERDAAMRRVADCQEAVRVAEQALAQAKKRLETARSQAAEADNVADEAEEKAVGSAARLGTLDAMLKSAADIATANARWTEREKLDAELKRLEADHAEKTGAIEAIDKQKVDMLAGARFPVDGLAFGFDGVLYKGLPFEQASQAEQLRVSVAIGAARNPKLRVMTVREGSRLDKNGLVLLAQLAKERDLQVWLECVNEDGPATIVIRDGSAVR